MKTLNAVVIREALAGYAAANEVIEAERRAELARMSAEEAWTIWRDLMSGQNDRRDMQEGLDRLDLWQVQGLITIRSALDQMAEARMTE